MLFFLVGFFFARIIHSLNVFPGCNGFGCGNYGGSGRHLDTVETTVYKVTSLSSSDDEGTLGYCIKQNRPRVCIFEVSGSIQYDPTSAKINIRYPYLTIAGETAPSPGIMLSGAHITIVTHDVLIKHITVRTSPEIEDDPDSIGVYGTNVVLDHVSASYSIDEIISSNSFTYGTKLSPNKFTVSNSIFSHALDDSTHSEGTHSKGTLIGPCVSEISFHNNFYAHNIDRNIFLSGGEPGGSYDDCDAPTKFEVINNVFYNYRYPTVIAGHTLDHTIHNPQYGHIVKNWYIPGDDTMPDSNSEKYFNYVVELKGSEYSRPVHSGSKVYIDDNFSKTRTSSSDENHLNVLVPSSDYHANDFVFTDGMNHQYISKTINIKEQIIKNAGSRPVERDQEDTNVINDLKFGTGRVINCLETDGTSRCADPFNAGSGHTLLSSQTRTLNVPENNVVESNGYTTIENWLFEFARDLEDYECFGIDKDASTVCSSNGKCVATDHCICTQESENEDCKLGTEEYTCEPNCMNLGVCVAENTCQCSSGFSGSFCQLEVLCNGVMHDNSTVCSGHGNCLAKNQTTTEGQCSCSFGYIGSECSNLFFEDENFLLFGGIAAGVIGIIILLLLLFAFGLTMGICIGCCCKNKKEVDDFELQGF